MARLYTFPIDGDLSTCKEEFKLRSDALADLNKLGLECTSRVAFQNMLSTPELQNTPELSSPIVEDAYRAMFQHYIVSHKKSPGVAEYELRVREVEDLITIRNHARAYFDRRNINATASDSLYAASLLSGAMKVSPHLKEQHKALIGDEAYKIFEEAQNMFEASHKYFAETAKPEAKLLHLLACTRDMQALDIRMRSQSATAHDCEKAHDFCHHVTSLFLTERSMVETCAIKQTAHLRESVNKYEQNMQAHAPHHS